MRRHQSSRACHTHAPASKTSDVCRPIRIKGRQLMAEETIKIANFRLRCYLPRNSNVCTYPRVVGRTTYRDPENPDSSPVIELPVKHRSIIRSFLRLLRRRWTTHDVRSALSLLAIDRSIRLVRSSPPTDDDDGDIFATDSRHEAGHRWCPCDTRFESISIIGPPTISASPLVAFDQTKDCRIRKEITGYRRLIWMSCLEGYVTLACCVPRVLPRSAARRRRKSGSQACRNVLNNGSFVTWSAKNIHVFRRRYVRLKFLTILLFSGEIASTSWRLQRVQQNYPGPTRATRIH